MVMSRCPGQLCGYVKVSRAVMLLCQGVQGVMLLCQGVQGVMLKIALLANFYESVVY